MNAALPAVTRGQRLLTLLLLLGLALIVAGLVVATLGVVAAVGADDMLMAPFRWGPQPEVVAA